MPKENQTLHVPFRLVDSSGAFIDDTTVGNYDIVVEKDGVLFVPGGGFTIVAASNKGRHTLSFAAGTEGQYNVFIDHNTPGNEVSIEGATIFIDKFLTSDIGDGAAIADAVWEELIADHETTAGSAAAFVKRILQLSEPDVEIDPNTNEITLRDRTTGTLLIKYDVTGIIDTRITDLDA